METLSAKIKQALSVYSLPTDQQLIDLLGEEEAVNTLVDSRVLFGVRMDKRYVGLALADVEALIIAHDSEVSAVISTVSASVRSATRMLDMSQDVMEEIDAYLSSETSNIHHV